MLRLTYDTEQHGSAFGDIFSSWISHNSNLALDVQTDLKPEKITVHQNYPNPFNPTTQINYDLQRNEYISIDIYNVTGHKVKSVIEGMQRAGYNSITWDATNDLWKLVSAGMYIYTIRAGEFIVSKKMLFLK